MKPFNNKGVSTIAALFVLLTLLSLGGVIAYLAAGGQEGRGLSLSSTQAFYVTQAGIEWGMKRIFDSQSEVTAGTNFGPGSFVISSQGITMTVTGTVGNAVRSYRVQKPTQADCFNVDVNSANLVEHDSRITNLRVNKTCLASVTIDKMLLTWESDDDEAELIQIRIENVDIYNNPAGVPSGTEVDVTNYTIANGSTHVFSHIKWNNEIENDENVVITFTMGDTSTKTVTLNFVD